MKLFAWYMYIHMYISFFLVNNDIDVLTRYKRSRQFAVAQKRGGVVEECCFSSCSYENLLLYCSQVRTNNSSTKWRHDRDTGNDNIIFVKRYIHVNCVIICVSDGTLFRSIVQRSNTDYRWNKQYFVCCMIFCNNNQISPTLNYQD